MKLITLIIGIVLLISFVLMCGKKSSDPGSNLPPAGLAVTDSVTGKGIPQNTDLELRITSDSVVVDTLLDTISITGINNAKWDIIIDTFIIPGSIPLDSQVITGTFQVTPLVDTTITLDLYQGNFIVSGLPAGTYTLTQRVTGEFRDFYAAPDTQVTFDGLSSFAFAPTYRAAPFGSMDGFVFSELDTTPLFDTVEVTIKPRNLDGKRSFRTNSTGYYLIPYVPLEQIELTVKPVTPLDTLYDRAKLTITKADTAKETYTFYLKGK